METRSDLTIEPGTNRRRNGLTFPISQVSTKSVWHGLRLGLGADAPRHDHYFRELPTNQAHHSVLEIGWCFEATRAD
jgi:hypothetical protein